MKIMKALILKKTDWETTKGFELVEIPEPILDEVNNPADKNYVILKVQYAGICGTDRGIWHRQAFRDVILKSIDEESETYVILEPRLGGVSGIQSGSRVSDAFARDDKSRKNYRIIGHEFCGEVVKVGSNVKNVQVGDFVSPESHVVCQECYQCQRGQKEVCTNEKILGISHDGGFAEYAKIPAHILWKTDTTKIRPEISAMQEPFGNAVHAGSKVDLKNKTVAIFGLGPIGSFLVLVAKGLGAKTIIGVDVSEQALENGKKLGVDYTIRIKPSADSNQPSANAKIYAHDSVVAEEIKKLTGGVGVDVSFEMAGFNSSVNNCLYATRRGGDIVLFGIKQGDFVLEDYNRLIVHGFTFHAVIGRQLWQTWEITKKLFEDKNTGVQEKMFKIILNQGEGTILPIAEYTKEKFAEMMSQHAKLLIKF
jgi:threonine 3-dehydrogenase